MTRLVLVFLIAGALIVNADEADDFKNKFEEFRQQCISSTGVSKQLTDDLKEGKLTSEDDKLKEYIFCVNKKAGFQKENGDFQIDVLRKVLSRNRTDESVNEVLNKCLEKKNTPQETSYQSLKCALSLTRN